MNWKRLLIVGLGLIWLGVVVAIAKTSVDRLGVLPWGNPVGESLSAEVAQDTEVGQVFAAHLPGLCAIELVLDKGTSVTAREVRFHLKANPAADHDIWNSEFSTKTVVSGDARRFEFERIADSVGEEFYFYLDSPTSQPGDAIAVRIGAEAELPGATAFQDGAPIPGELQFHAYYCLNAREKLQLLLARLAEGRPYWFGTTTFYVILAIAYAVLLGLFLLLTVRAILDEREGTG